MVNSEQKRISNKDTAMNIKKIIKSEMYPMKQETKLIKDQKASSVHIPEENSKRILDAPCHATRFFKYRRTSISDTRSQTTSEPQFIFPQSKKKSKSISSVKKKKIKKSEIIPQDSEKKLKKKSIKYKIKKSKIKSKSKIKLKDNTISTKVNSAISTQTQSINPTKDTDLNSLMDIEENEEDRDDDVVNCVCGFQQEDGCMIQCEQCLCWQHTTCFPHVNYMEEEFYLCHICSNPRNFIPAFTGLNNFYLYHQGKLIPNELNQICELGPEQQDIIKATNLLIGKGLNALHQLNGVSYNFQNEVNNTRLQNLNKFFDDMLIKTDLLKKATDKKFSKDPTPPDFISQNNPISGELPTEINSNTVPAVPGLIALRKMLGFL